MRELWWHINAVFDEPPKKEVAWFKIRRTGWPRKKVISISSTSDPALWKNTIEKRSYIRVKMGEGRKLRLVVECNRNNWYSTRLTTNFLTCLEMSRQSQVLQQRKMGRALSRGTPHRKHEVDQDSCLYTGIQFPQTVGTTWLHYSCVLRLF
jgi:hypothetical protein